jgi:hypothetical protein
MTTEYYQAGVAFQRAGRHALACRCFRRALETLDEEQEDRVLAFKARWNLSQCCLALQDDAGKSIKGGASIPICID